MTYTLQIPTDEGPIYIEGLPTLEDCQKAYVHKRTEMDLGASGFGSGTVYDTEKVAGRISYNGRLWPAESWYQGQQPLREAPR